MGGTAYNVSTKVYDGMYVLTLHPEVHSLADGGGHPVAGDAEVRPYVTTPYRVEYQGGAAYTCG